MTDKKHKSLTKKYKKLFSCARDIVYEYNPMGITGDGDAPEDEYDMEISKILPLLSKGLSLDELSFRIGLVFYEYFGVEPFQSQDSYKPLAEALVKMKEEIESSQ